MAETHLNKALSKIHGKMRKYILLQARAGLDGCKWSFSSLIIIMWTCSHMWVHIKNVKFWRLFLSQLIKILLRRLPGLEIAPQTLQQHELILCKALTTVSLDKSSANVARALETVSGRGPTVKLPAERASNVQHSRSRSIATRRDMTIPLNSTQLKTHVDTVSSDRGSPVQKRHCQDLGSPAEAHHDAEGTRPPALQGKPKDWSQFCLEMKGFGGISD